MQRALQVLLVAGAILLAFVPRRRSPLQLIALTAVLLVGFESVMTYWLYTYVPWFWPPVAAALLLGAGAATPAREPEPEPETDAGVV
jgi:peptidoglycan/LPS O-acetylase OafA/YrhL